MPGESEIIDKTTEDVTDKGGAPDDDAIKPDDDAAAKPEDKDTPPVDDSGKDRETAQFMQNLLEQYNVETPEQLNAFIGELAGIKDALGDEDIQDLLDNKDLMIRYQAHWAEQDEKAKRADETPEETVKRLDGELKKVKLAREQEKERQREQKENARLVTDFNRFVGKEVDSLKIGDYLKPHLKKFLGVDNPIHDIDLTNKVGIKKLIQDSGRMLEDLEQTILKKAKVKQDDVPKMDDGTESAPAGTEPEEPTVKNMADARKQATALLKQRLTQSGGK